MINLYLKIRVREKSLVINIKIIINLPANHINGRFQSNCFRRWIT